MNEEIKEKILKYLSDNVGNNKRNLKVLDNKYREYYTGVTLNYITYDLFKAKYKKSDVTKALKELFLNKEIKSLFCPHVQNVVFEPISSHHWSFFYGYANYNLEYFENYMNKFIKNE